MFLVAAQDRRDMLEEIMRKGTSSLGADVPSEREINRLAARSDDEFRMFEKMDAERRQKENYRSRLMEEHEVPEWAYSAPDKVTASKGFDYSNISGKRPRKEVRSYADGLSDLQFMKAVESGEDVSMFSGKGKRRNPFPSKSSVVPLNENVPVVSVSEDTYDLSPPSKKHKSEGPNIVKHENHAGVFQITRKKRSNSSFDSKGRSSNGR